MLKSFFRLFILSLCFFSISAHAFETYPVTDTEKQLLEKIQRDTFKYFTKFTDRNTGLVQDSSKAGSPASIAATGFGLASWAIASERGWASRHIAEKMILKTLRALDSNVSHHRGFFYHFLDMRTGKRVWRSEASSIDTALVIAGALLAADYFKDSPEIQRLTQKIYDRVEWNWMLNGSDMICMGWTPEGKFLPHYWDSYNELIILQALALGSSTHPVPPHVWQAWFRSEDEFNGRKVVFSDSGSLFTYQYSHAFIDFRNLDDRGINYFENSVQATLANREYSLQYEKDYRSYNKYSWGLSASIGPGGYKAYGGKPGKGLHDGTIAPYAAISSLVFTPKESIEATKYFYVKLRDKIYGSYGFKGSFNVDKKYYPFEFLGIDQGATVLMIENFLHQGNLWKRFMKNGSIQKWIQAADLKIIPKKKSPEKTPAKTVVESISASKEKVAEPRKESPITSIDQKSSTNAEEKDILTTAKKVELKTSLTSKASGVKSGESNI